MKAADIMTTNVITASDQACVADVAELLLKNNISAVPVVDETGAMVGIVSEGDLVRRAEIGTQHRRSWWLELVARQGALASEYLKEHGQRVVDVMTRDVITVSPDTPLAEIANLIEKHGIKRVPVVDNGKVVGIVSRSNLVQVLAARAKNIITIGEPDDALIRERVIAALRAEPWCPFMLNVLVHKGHVDLWGMAANEAEKEAARAAAEATPGVVAVTNNLVIRPSIFAG